MTHHDQTFLTTSPSQSKSKVKINKVKRYINSKARLVSKGLLHPINTFR